MLAVDVDDRTAVLALLGVVRDGPALGGGLLELATDETLDGRDGGLGVGDCLVLGCLADDTLAILAECDDRRRGAVTLGVDDDRGLATLENRYTRVRGAKVNTNNLAHYGLHEIWPSKLRLGSRALFDLMIV